MASVAVTTTPVLAVEGVEKSFRVGVPWRRRRVAVVCGTSLEVCPGELVGLALAGALLGQLGATYVVLFLAMLGIGILQNPMFGDGAPSGLAYAFPDYGAGRVVIDGAFSAGFHAWG
jgi:hypothetical protein